MDNMDKDMLILMEFILEGSRCDVLMYIRIYIHACADLEGMREIVFQDRPMDPLVETKI